MEPSTETNGLLRDFVAGAVAGAFAITVSQPLDTVRVRIQQACSASGGVPSALSVLSSMVRKEGLLSPWKGLTYPLLFASVQSAILFQAYGWTLRQLASPEDAEQPQRSQQQEPPQQSQLHGIHHSPVAGQRQWPPAMLGGAEGAGSSSGSGSSAGSVALHRTHHHESLQATQQQQPQQLASHPHQRQVHQLHLHHHHHAVSQQMRETEVHGPHSVTGAVVHYVASSLGLEPAGPTQRSLLAGQAAGSSHSSVAGMAQVFLWSPVELLKLRAQLQTASPGTAGYCNPAALAAQVVRQDGVAGLYRGFTLTVVRDVPSYAMYFWLYHDIAAALSPGLHPEQAPPATQVLAGGLAGVLAWLPIYPLDVIKTRVQAVSTAASTKTWWQHCKELQAERALYRGCMPTLVRAFVMDGASFLGYTTTLKLLAGGGGSGSRSGSSGSSNGSGSNT
eukprot:XP_001698926.1 carnitine/acylcarnitine translocase [Chlamydomonas reinhardtii]